MAKLQHYNLAMIESKMLHDFYG